MLASSTHGLCRAAGAAVLVLTFAALSAGAAPPTLPNEDQVRVNQAIDRGVAFLKATQNPVGTWGNPKGPGAGKGWAVGYTALPGLTLLECGLPPNHPQIQAAARLVRTLAPQLDHTYEISLAILFLDKLGDPKDKRVIQSLAARLIAGQAHSGGWGYRCPNPLKEFPPGYQTAMLDVLRKLEEQEAITAPVSGPGGSPGDLTGKPTEGKPGDPAITGKPTDGKPGDLTGKPLDGKPGDLSIDASPDGVPNGPGFEPKPCELAARFPRPGRCIKMGEDRRVETTAPPSDRPADKGGKPKPPPAKVVVPVAFRGLPAFLDPAQLPPEDPKNRIDKWPFSTTDNSNTQFAILALWAARRYDVPLARTFARLDYRFRTSQNGDGGWTYHFAKGNTPPMTCVGLLGLAVAHGLAREDRPNARRNDPALINGFVALTRHLGEPTGKMEGVPIKNLYFLWSVERVAMLYDLPTIGKKDWYRWGAEILVSNQDLTGKWGNGGGYHGASDTINTCLALLFLKRANLATDLTNKLPFNPDDLSKEIASKSAPPPPPPPPPAKPSEPAPVLTNVPPGGEQPPPDRKTNVPLVVPPTDSSPGPTPASTATDSEDRKGSRVVLAAVLIGGVVLLMLLGGGALLIFLAARGGNRAGDEPDDRPRRRSGRRAGDDDYEDGRPARPRRSRR